MKRIHTSLAAAIAVCAASLAFTGCLSEKTGMEPEARKAGQLKLVPMNGLAKTAASTSGTYVFTLDTTRTSFQQYFILQNTGDEPITDIELVTDDPNFTFSPSRIAVLPPSAGTSVMQVIKLNVVHGKRLDAIGTGTFLTPGAHSVDASITGTTEEGGNEVAVEEDITFNTFAQLARFTLETDVDTFQLGDLMQGMTFDTEFDILGIPHYYVPMDSVRSLGNGIVMRNTGNTTLYIRNVNPHTYALQPAVILPPDSAWAFNSAYLEVDSKGVAFEPENLPTTTSGKVYFIAYPDY